MEGKLQGLEEVRSGSLLLGLIVRRGFVPAGIQFLTPDDYPQQIAGMTHSKGHRIPAHTHNPVHREIETTMETILVRSGRLRVDFYLDDRSYVESRILEAGDVVLLAAGGHGFECLEETDMLEIKQGPYAGSQDKIRFDGVAGTALQVKGSIDE
jgi:quercetin dioxygenase-like cupin family protein